ncbi:hypothetical protein A3I41_04325 [Candidatus Uhrbacteria bacterium RIFCSPLOWO2_02_FULL_48_18]|uniref:Baseplate protein J-like domain-containing protein n=1 Tax=Candidatus Uhrbacteria bacterium RIFCSPLOWO2_02_FULL_48_18 TaxID=1802408 RepID=A0A1F7V7T8_9BACT|nr:MAG: hypothetical protein A3I41_04325 [Candidatus Uhrbacteria bacterium RIFCSPLOWO2_02_FULL_48_18]
MATKKVATRKRVPVKRVIRVSEQAEIKMPPPHSHATAVPLMLYRRIALAFIVVVAAVLLVVMYLSTMQAVIHVKPVAKDFSSDLIVHTAMTPLDETDIRGTVVSGSMTKTKTFEPSGEGAKQVEGKSSGTVTITNKSNAPQALVATTRLLSTSGVLFRLDKSVVAPAGGTVDATVHADKPGITGDIGPTHFTIPGLNETKQAQIFADSKTAFTGGVQSVAVVSKAELQKSIDALKEEVLDSAKDMLRAQAGTGFDGEVFAADITNQKTSIKPDTESKSYDVTLTITVTGVFYDRTALKKLFSEHLYEGLGQGQDFSSGTKIDDMEVTIDQYDSTQKVASLHAHLEGQMTITRTNKALDVGRFVGMSEEDVRKTLVASGVAESVEVDFFPFWLNKIPRLKDHIYIEFN